MDSERKVEIVRKGLGRWGGSHKLEKMKGRWREAAQRLEKMM